MIYRQSENSYIFPILNETHVKATSIDYRIDKVLKIVNADLKQIAKLTGINENLTTMLHDILMQLS